VIGMLFVLFLPWGPVGIAVAWVLSSWILAIPALRYAGRPADLKAADIVMAVWKYVAASAVAGGTAGLIIRHVPLLMTASGWAGALDRSVIVSALFGALYLAAVVLLHGGLDPLRQIVTLVRDMLPGRSWRSFSAVRVTSDVSTRAAI